MFGHESRLTLCSQVDATVVGFFADLFSVTNLVLLGHEMVKSKMIAKEGSID